MIRTKTVIIPAVPERAEEIPNQVVCDRCGASVEIWSTDPNNWLGKEWHRFDRITVTRETGTCYPEGGETVHTQFHCCLSCWDDLILFFRTGPTIEDSYF